MPAILLIVYGIYLTAVGVRGNAPALGTALAGEKQFGYWIIVLLVVGALWEFPNGGKVAKPLAALIVIGFLLKSSNYQTIAANARALFSGTASASPGGAGLGG
jgi:hypothetical protein